MKIQKTGRFLLIDSGFDPIALVVEDVNFIQFSPKKMSLIIGINSFDANYINIDDSEDGIPF